MKLEFHSIQEELPVTSVWNISVDTFKWFCETFPDAEFYFDDGRASQYYLAAPILEEYGLKGIFGIVTKHLGKQDRMRRVDVLDLHNRGHVIANHTENHKNLCKLSDRDLGVEIVYANTTLTNLLGSDPTLLIPPYNAVDDRVRKWAKEYGYKVVEGRIAVQNGASKEYWESVYAGETGAERGGTEHIRFGEVMKLLEGDTILDVGAGFAQLARQIRRVFPTTRVTACDASYTAKKQSRYTPYVVADCYSLPFKDKSFDTVISTQMMEYLERPRVFLREARRVAEYGVFTVPMGTEKGYDRIQNFTMESFKALLCEVGEVQCLYNIDSLMVAKVHFE